MPEDKSTMTDSEVDLAVSEISGWRREGIFLKKDFVFANFKEINAFLPWLTKTIVEQNHHPDFALICARKTVSVEVTTHSAGRATRADINLAKALNAWPRP